MQMLFDHLTGTSVRLHVGGLVKFLELGALATAADYVCCKAALVLCARKAKGASCSVCRAAPLGAA